MKLQYKPIEGAKLGSFHVKRIQEPYLGGNWHFHKEFELIYFLEGQGLRVVGDHISNFKKGELVLVGEWLPHLWRNEEGINKELNSDFIVLKFPKLLDGVNLFSLPEFSEIRSLLLKASQGIHFSHLTVSRVHDSILKLLNKSSTEKLIHSLSLLNQLSKEKEYKLLSSTNFNLPIEISQENRLQKVINFIFENYNKAISLEKISSIAYMTPPAFCRYFKNRTNKTFSQFLNEFRISRACLYLIDGEKSIKQICFYVGFNSMTNFNRTFKKVKEITPTEFRSNYTAIRGNLKEY